MFEINEQFVDKNADTVVFYLNYFIFTKHVQRWHSAVYHKTEMDWSNISTFIYSNSSEINSIVCDMKTPSVR